MIYVISDLHGYPHEGFLLLLEQARFGEEDFLYILGDVVDRNGDGGVQTLLWLLGQPNAQLLLGNHEAMLLSCEFVFREITDETLGAFGAEQLALLNTYLENGGGVTLKALRALPHDARADLFDYLREAPLYEAVTAGGRDYLLVHAGLGGFSPEKRLADYTPEELIWTAPEPGQTYFADIMTILGHRPTMSFGPEHRGQIFRTETWMDIDVGAGFGQKPVLLRLDDLREFRPE